MFSIHLLLSDYQRIYLLPPSLPPLCTAVSGLIQASADGITVHYYREGDWDLGAQWGVTPLSEGRQLVINDNAPVMTRGVWESAMMSRALSITLDGRKKR